MMPVIPRDPPEVTEALKDAVRTRTKFVVERISVSGWHSAVNRNSFLVQCEGTIAAIYDKKCDQWFVNANQGSTHMLWTVQLIVDAVGRDAIQSVNYKMLRQIQKNGFVSVVRKRIGA